MASSESLASSKIQDPSNLTSLFFEHLKKNQEWTLVSSDSFQIVFIDEQRGRGLVVTRDLQAGSCLFVIPPTVAVSPDQVAEEFSKTTVDDPATRLEQVSETLLIQEMKKCISTSGDASKANSFLVLEGRNKVSSSIPSLECLLALDRSSPLIKEAPDESEDLLQIVRRNAFGPDFTTYSSIASSLLLEERQRIHRVLGLYPLADMMNHSCQPNTVRVYVGEYMVVHTSTKVAAGEELTASYVPPTFSYVQRQAALFQNHGFTCQCVRCQMDATFWQNPPPKINDMVELQQQQQQTGSLQSNNSKIEDAISFLEDELLPGTKPAQLQRSLRLGFTPLYMAHLNQALATRTKSDSDILRLCMQLHFGFLEINPASTEHLSILHLGYELIGKMHSQSNNQSKTLPQLRFWTEQVKQACMTRYGSMGQDLESVRRMMQHTRMVLRTRDGWSRSEYAFI